MSERMERHAAALGARRSAAILDALTAAELPAGVTAERSDDSVVIRGPGLVRLIAFDARLAGLGLAARRT
jgi:hypothetical protein